MHIEYRVDEPISAEQFVGVLRRSTLGERRPIDDEACIAGMLEHASLMITAWDGDELVGIARSVTDFHYACYLSDLAVDTRYQGAGIGGELVLRTRRAVGPRCTVRLVSAPAAMAYYPKLGFVPNDRCWELPATAAEHGSTPVEGGTPVSEPDMQEQRGIVVASEMGLTIRSMRDVMEVVGAAYAADGIVLTPDDVDASFFDLRSGLAGELFQKVTTYGLRLALVVPDPAVYGPRWADLAFEHANHRVIRFVSTRADAEAWVSG